MKVKWVCPRCKKVNSDAYKDGLKGNLWNMLERAASHPIAQTWEITLVCDNCDTNAGTAYIPTGENAFAFTGDVVFIYTFDDVTEEVSSDEENREDQIG